MDKRLSKADQRALLDAVARAKEAAERMKEKEEEKRWSEMELPLMLSDSLARLTKTDLSTIRSTLNIRGASKLNKQELIGILEQQIPERLPDQFQQMDETRYGILRKIADRGGHGSIRLESHQLDYFKERGLLFSGTYKGKPTLAMPREVLDLFKTIDGLPYRQKVRKNTVWIKLAQGLLFYYGSLGVSELLKLLHQYEGDDLKWGDCYRLLEEARSFYREIKFDEVGFSNIRVFDAGKVKKEHQIRDVLPYYPFTKEQLLQAGEPGFVDRHPIYQAFVDFIRSNYTISREEADNLVEECVYAVQIGQPLGNIIEFLQSQLEMDGMETINQFASHAVKLSNSTRQWFLKGHSPDELSASRRTAVPGEVIDFATRKKIGRNDPCPCGSGQKFKKCCGG